MSEGMKEFRHLLLSPFHHNIIRSRYEFIFLDDIVTDIVMRQINPYHAQKDEHSAVSHPRLNMRANSSKPIKMGFPQPLKTIQTFSLLFL